MLKARRKLSLINELIHAGRAPAETSERSVARAFPLPTQNTFCAMVLMRLARTVLPCGRAVFLCRSMGPMPEDFSAGKGEQRFRAAFFGEKTMGDKWFRRAAGCGVSVLFFIFLAEIRNNSP